MTYIEELRARIECLDIIGYYRTDEEEMELDWLLEELRIAEIQQMTGIMSREG